MIILIEIAEKEIKLSLRDGKNGQIDEARWSRDFNLGEKLLGEIDNILLKNNLKPSDIDRADVKTSISDNLTTVRIAETVAKTLNYYKNVD